MKQYDAALTLCIWIERMMSQKPPFVTHLKACSVFWRKQSPDFEICALLLDTHLAALYFQAVAQVLDFFAALLCRKHATVLVTLKVGSEGTVVCCDQRRIKAG